MYSKVFIIHELRTACRAKRQQHDSLGFNVALLPCYLVRHGSSTTFETGLSLFLSLVVAQYCPLVFFFALH